jgi:hypothetical protein
MIESIVQDLSVERCFVCGCVRELELHHIMHGTANRRLATRYKLTCWLCRTHHTGRFGVHSNPELNRLLQQEAQRAFERRHTRQDWMNIFGKNYL